MKNLSTFFLVFVILIVVSGCGFNKKRSFSDIPEAMAGAEAEKAGNYLEALDHYDKAISDNEEVALLYIKRAEIFFKVKGDYIAAIDNYVNYLKYSRYNKDAVTVASDRIRAAADALSKKTLAHSMLATPEGIDNLRKQLADITEEREVLRKEKASLLKEKESLNAEIQKQAYDLRETKNLLKKMTNTSMGGSEIPKQAVASEPRFTYVAVPGDTIYELAKKFYDGDTSRVSDIRAANPQIKNDVIKTGDKLVIP